MRLKYLLLCLIPSIALAQPVPGTQGVIVDGANRSIKATVLDYTGSNPIACRLTDTNGDYVGAGAGTQYTEDAAAAANPIGSALNLVRADTPAGVTTTDGDNVAARGTDKGELYVKHIDAIPVTQSGTWDEVGINDSGNSITVDGTVTVTDGSGALNVIVDSGTTAVTQATATSLKTQIFGDDTTQAIDTDASGQLQTDVLTLPNVTIGTFPDNEPMNVAQINGVTVLMGAGANGTGAQRFTLATDDELNDDADAIRISVELIDDSIVADDAAFTPATTKVQMCGFEFDDTTPDSVNEGDGGAVRMSANRNLYSTIRDAAGNERGANVNASSQLSVSVDNTVTVASHAVTNAGTFVVQENGGSLTALQLIDDWDNAASDGASISGDVAHDSADAGEPVKIGAKAVSSLVGQTIVAANDRSNAFSDADGTIIVRQLTTAADILQERISNTDGASTALSTFGATASQRNMITGYACYNASATGGYVDLRDGTAGSIFWTIPLPAGGGAVQNFQVPLRQATQNTALAFDVSGALTTVYCSFQGYKSKL